MSMVSLSDDVGKATWSSSPSLIQDSMPKTISGWTLLIKMWKGSFLALLLWQFTFIIVIDSIFLRVVVRLWIGLSGEELKMGGPAKEMEMLGKVSLSMLLTSISKNMFDVLTEMFVIRPVLKFKSPQVLQIHIVDVCPSLLYWFVDMPMQSLCIHWSHPSHPSHCRASLAHVTSWVHTAHGKSAV